MVFKFLKIMLLSVDWHKCSSYRLHLPRCIRLQICIISFNNWQNVANRWLTQTQKGEEQTDPSLHDYKIHSTILVSTMTHHPLLLVSVRPSSSLSQSRGHVYGNLAFFWFFNWTFKKVKAVPVYFIIRPSWSGYSGSLQQSIQAGGGSLVELDGS